MARSKFGDKFRLMLFGRKIRFSLAFITIWLNGVAVLLLAAAILLLFWLMILFYPTRGLLVVLFLLFLALIGFLCP